MGAQKSVVLDLIQKLGSWISWGAGNIASLPAEFDLMPGEEWKVCCECDVKLGGLSRCYCCQGCGRTFCARCMRGYECSVVGKESQGACVRDGTAAGDSNNACKFCIDGPLRKYGKKVHPSPCPEESPESDSFCSNSKRMNCVSYESNWSQDHDSLPNSIPQSTVPSFISQLSPTSFRRPASRSVQDDNGDSGSHYISSSSEFCHDSSESDIDTSSVDNRQSVDSSPLVSPSRIDFATSRVRPSVEIMQERKSNPHCQDNRAVLRKPLMGLNNVENPISCSNDSVFKKSLDFENNHHIWCPPPPEDEDEEMETNFFKYDDEDDDVGDSGAVFSSSSSLSGMFSLREKQHGGNKESRKADIQRHFRALVSQLMESEGVKVVGKHNITDWLDIVTALAWQGANFVKPDTRRGGSMDPCDYVKVKCIASGIPRDSTLVKGVVCTKNIKHKRMTSQYKNPRVLILGGALEYQRVSSQLASFNTLLQQESDHFKMIISKIEARRPNVLLVEKSVSSFAQELLLGKDISLVLNVKRPLLECISRCIGAYITPSVDDIPTTRVGTCECFRLERVSEEHNVNQSSKRPAKTLMFFEGCPRRLGCTVVLRGACREELKKLKRIMLYAIFAAHHLALETSFLADEGATLPKMTVHHELCTNENSAANNATSPISCALATSNNQNINGVLVQDEYSGLSPELGGLDSFPQLLDRLPIASGSVVGEVVCDAQSDHSASFAESDLGSFKRIKDPREHAVFRSEMTYSSHVNCQDPNTMDEKKLDDGLGFSEFKDTGEREVSAEYLSGTDTHQSFLVSFSSYCVRKEIVCERSQQLRIKFYGCFDKPLGRYLLDDIFDLTARCRSCQQPPDAHVLCYTHQLGNLTINTKRLDLPKLPGDRDSKIWMWHRCLKCTDVDGVPPASHRVVMSDAAWGLSFGKFLELSFSNHATADRIATCGHSLNRDCLRFFGLGNMVTFFRYTPIDILSVHLPSLVLEFSGSQPEWLWKEAMQLKAHMENFYTEISKVLDSIEERCKSMESELSDISVLENHIIDLKEQLENQKYDYKVLLQPASLEYKFGGHVDLDMLELNRLRHSLIIVSRVWDRQLYLLDSLLKRNPLFDATPPNGQLKQVKDETMQVWATVGNELKSEKNEQSTAVPFVKSDSEIAISRSPSDSIFSCLSNLSHQLDSKWTGSQHILSKRQAFHMSQPDNPQSCGASLKTLDEKLSVGMTPLRVRSFDSDLRIQERSQRGLLPFALHISKANSFHASKDYRNKVRDHVSTTSRGYSLGMSSEALKLNHKANAPSSFIPSASHLAEGARLLPPNTDHCDIIIAVYDNEPTSVISYALVSKEYEDWVSSSTGTRNAEGSAAVDISTLQSMCSPGMDYIHFGNYGSIGVSSSISSLFTDPKKSPHMKFSFEDESTVGGKVKFSVTCYFAKEFNSLRNTCCPNKVDFVRSLSRCRQWSAQGGKSSAYFAKSLDERFIIKQVTKTELESFEEFAPRYFKYLKESVDPGGPTCLSKILGIYQVTSKNMKTGKETKMDLMVMENLFYGRNISRVYDLKGSLRSRYNSNTTGENKVLLDSNLLETLLTRPIFLGSKAKKMLERAVWNDTLFLASVDVMDYSLLAGIDEERKELVVGIIDYMRQYTWDKHLETWVKASGILGGPKNESPTIISPKQYKKRFRKAMTTYFLTVPD